MREEGLSVKDAAYRLGFSDPSAFSRAFKRWTGSSPTGMRRACPPPERSLHCQSTLGFLLSPLRL